MKEIWNWIQVVITAIGGFFGWFLGGADGFLYALLVFVVIDYLTGVLCAIADKTLSSEVGFIGISRKVLIFVLVGVANILDVYVIGDGSVLEQRLFSSIYQIEGISLLENSAHLGLPIPEKLKDVFKTAP